MEMMHMDVAVLTEEKGSGMENLKIFVLFFQAVENFNEEKNSNVLQ
jgi:hypothetical protein